MRHYLSLQTGPFSKDYAKAIAAHCPGLNISFVGTEHVYLEYDSEERDIYNIRQQVTDILRSPQKGNLGFILRDVGYLCYRIGLSPFESIIT